MTITNRKLRRARLMQVYIPPKGSQNEGTRAEGTRKKENPRYTSQIGNWSSDKTVDSQEDFTYKIVVNSNMNLLVLWN